MGLLTVIASELRERKRYEVAAGRRLPIGRGQRGWGPSASGSG
jgi:hypothetical protein